MTGSASGCGRVLADAFAAEAATVVCCDTNTDGVAPLRDAVEGAGGMMTFIEAHLADESVASQITRPHRELASRHRNRQRTSAVTATMDRPMR